MENENKLGNKNIKEFLKNKVWMIAFLLSIPTFTTLGIVINNKFNFVINGEQNIIGDFNVVDRPQDNTNDETISRQNGTITFAGYGKYNVNQKNPNIEIKNPSGNFVDMVFILKDEISGEIIAKTNKVQAGKYVYVNVLNYYKNPGNYNAIIETLTYDSKSGVQLNGMNQKISFVVNK